MIGLTIAQDPSLLQDIPTQDREEGNASSHNDKSVTIENETHSKSESAKESGSDDKTIVVESDSTSIPNEAVVASEQVDLNGDSGKTMGHMEVKVKIYACKTCIYTCTWTISHHICCIGLLFIDFFLSAQKQLDRKLHREV